MPLADISFGELLLFALEIFFFVIWIWILITILTDLFRLTAGEARFVRMLVHRRSLQKASEALSISPETARRHLKSVFEKTGTHSQSELAQLLVRQPSARMFNSHLVAEDLQRFKPAAE